MKQASEKASGTFAREYSKVYIRLLTAVVNMPRRIISKVDGYFFDEECAEIRPYFYGSISFALAIILFLYLAIGE